MIINDTILPLAPTWDPLYIMYIVEGALMFPANIILFAAIMRFEKLRKRKELIIVAALSFADAFNGMAYLLAGAVRTHRMQVGTAEVLATPWDCFNIFIILWYMFEPLSAMMLAVVSIDRLFAVCAPLQYFKQTRGYAIKLCAIPYGFQLCTLPLLTYLSYTKRTEYTVKWLCWSQHGVMEPLHDTLFYFAPTVFGTSSVIIYVLVVIKQLKRVKHKFSVQGDVNDLNSRQRKQREEDEARQQRLMVTLGLSTMFTFILLVIPSLVRTAVTTFAFDDPLLFDLIIYACIAANVNPILNLFLFISRHRDMRAAVGALICCKTKLPVPLQPTKMSAAFAQSVKAPTVIKPGIHYEQSGCGK